MTGKSFLRKAIFTKTEMLTACIDTNLPCYCNNIHTNLFTTNVKNPPQKINAPNPARGDQINLIYLSMERQINGKCFGS